MVAATSASGCIEDQPHHFNPKQVTGAIQLEDPGNAPYEDEAGNRYWLSATGERLTEEPNRVKWAWIEVRQEWAELTGLALYPFRFERLRKPNVTLQRARPCPTPPQLGLIIFIDCLSSPPRSLPAPCRPPYSPPHVCAYSSRASGYYYTPRRCRG
jgi:hypothetical protein